MTVDVSAFGLKWSAEAPSLEARRLLLGGMLLKNSGEDAVLLRAVIRPDRSKEKLKVEFRGESIGGSSGILYLVDECNHVLGESTLNATAYFDLPDRQEYALIVKVFPQSELKVSRVRIFPANEAELTRFARTWLRGTVAVVAPTYPTEENRYLCAFVHARVRAYLQAGLSCDVVCAFDGYDAVCFYEYEGVRVARVPLSRLKETLLLGSYEKTCLHFFDERYAEVFDDPELRGRSLILWSHNPETRYWDWPLFASPYFDEPAELTEEQVALFRQRDQIIRRFNERENVSWVFVSETLRRRSEELIGIRFNRAHEIPNVVDDSVFAFRQKDPRLRKKIIIVRKFENVSTYALDVAMQCIVELSRRPLFEDLEFNVYGAGGYYDELVAPVRGFENVHLHRRFLSRAEMASVYADHGIGLFATRFDSQGVAMGEAAMAGLAVVSSRIDAAERFLPNDIGLLAEVEDPASYADIIEGLYNDPERFVLCARRCHEKVFDLCRREKTIEREIALIRS